MKHDWNCPAWLSTSLRNQRARLRTARRGLGNSGSLWRKRWMVEIEPPKQVATSLTSMSPGKQARLAAAYL
jgi:hypothetical protein